MRLASRSTSEDDGIEYGGCTTAISGNPPRKPRPRFDLRSYLHWIGWAPLWGFSIAVSTPSRRPHRNTASALARNDPTLLAKSDPAPPAAGAALAAQQESI